MASSTLKYDSKKELRKMQREYMLEWYEKGVTKGPALKAKVEKRFKEKISVSTIKIWVNRFKDGEYDTEDRKRTGRPQKPCDHRILEAIERDPYISVTDLYVELALPRGEVKRLINKSRLINVSVMWVPKVLPEEALSARINLCADLYQRSVRENFFDRVIFEGEKTITYNKYKTHFKTKNAQRVLKPTEELVAKSGLKPHKIVLHMWWSTRGVIMYKLIGENVLGRDLYLNELDELRAEVLDRGFIKQTPILYNNSARYLDETVNAKIASFGWEQIVHPKYAPDLSPTDYQILAKLQYAFNTTLFTQLQEVEEFLYRYFENKPPKFYQEAVQIWPEKWHRVIETEGQYIPTNEKL